MWTSSLFSWKEFLSDNNTSTPLTIYRSSCSACTFSFPINTRLVLDLLSQIHRARLSNILCSCALLFREVLTKIAIVGFVGRRMLKNLGARDLVGLGLNLRCFGLKCSCPKCSDLTCLNQNFDWKRNSNYMVYSPDSDEHSPLLHSKSAVASSPYCPPNFEETDE